MNKKFSHPFGDEKKSPQTLQKVLRVVNKPYQKTYTNGINIQGEYLKKFGFEKGDKVEVLVSENQIQISKIINPIEEWNI